MARYGREWAIACMENTNGDVSPRVLSKCKLETPARDWVDLYLYEISKAYQINWRPEGMIDTDGESAEASAATIDEPDTAAQQQRLLEANLASAAKESGSGSNTPDEKGNDGDLGAKLPSAPSSQPHLTDVKNSTTSIPIIRPEDNSNNANNANGKLDLPTTPPSDPAQSARTVLIKSNLGQSPSSKGNGSISGADKKPNGNTFDVSCRVSLCVGSMLKG